MSDTTAPAATQALVWEEPPPSGVGRPESLMTEDIQSALKENPGKWLRLPNEMNQGTAGRLKARHQDYEFTTRKVEGKTPKTVNVWVRYIGPAPKKVES